MRSMAALGCDFAQVYGLTETTGAITSLMPADHDPDGPRAAPAAVGRPALRPRGAAHRRHRHRARTLPVGAVGEVWTRSDQNMLGLLEQARRDRPPSSPTTAGSGPATPAGSTPTGYLFLHDRIKDMIVSGGENVYPAEVENALLSHPAVADAAVIGVPDDRWGETVKAIVVRAPGASADDEEPGRRHHRRHPGPAGPLQVPDLGRLRRGPAPQPVGQGAQARAAPALLGGQRTATSTEPGPARAAPGSEQTRSTSRRSTADSPTRSSSIVDRPRSRRPRRPRPRRPRPDRSPRAGAPAPPPASGSAGAGGRARRRCRWPARSCSTRRSTSTTPVSNSSMMASSSAPASE